MNRNLSFPPHSWHVSFGFSPPPEDRALPRVFCIQIIGHPSLSSALLYHRFWVRDGFTSTCNSFCCTLFPYSRSIILHFLPRGHCFPARTVWESRLPSVLFIPVASCLTSQSSFPAYLLLSAYYLARSHKSYTLLFSAYGELRVNTDSCSSCALRPPAASCFPDQDRVTISFGKSGSHLM